MKRRAEEQAAAARREQGAGGAFGELPGQEQQENFELPDAFKKFMG
jgi:signal recognition particle subunit SRP54